MPDDCSALWAHAVWCGYWSGLVIAGCGISHNQALMQLVCTDCCVLKPGACCFCCWLVATMVRGWHLQPPRAGAFNADPITTQWYVCYVSG